MDNIALAGQGIDEERGQKRAERRPIRELKHAIGTCATAFVECAAVIRNIILDIGMRELTMIAGLTDVCQELKRIGTVGERRLKTLRETPRFDRGQRECRFNDIRNSILALLFETEAGRGIDSRLGLLFE